MTATEAIGSHEPCWFTGRALNNLAANGLKRVILWWGIVWLALGLSAELLASEGEVESERLTVRTVEEGELQRDDERRPSVMVSRVDVASLMSRGQDLADALGEVSGVYVQREAGFGQSSFLSVRGGNARQVVVEVEGLRLSAPVGVGFDLGQVMMGGFSSVDVYRGSGAALFGSGAVTGALRLNPRRGPKKGWEAKGELMGGSFGTGGATLSLGVGAGLGRALFFGGYRQSRGDFEFLDARGVAKERINNDHMRYNVGSTTSFERGRHRLRATAMWESGEAGSAGVSEFQESFGAARTDDHRGLMTIKWEGLGLLRGAQWEIDAYALAGAQARGLRYANEEGFLTGELFVDQSRYEGATLQAGAVGVGQAHLLRLELEGRLEGYQSRSQGYEDSQIEARRQVFAANLGDEWLLLDERLSLVGAVRAEWIGGEESFVRPILPALGAVWQIDRAWEVRANGARTFRMPDFDELYLESEGVRGDPDLLPEEAWAADLALRFRAGEGRFEAQIAGFYHWIDSMILFLPVSHILFEAQNLEGAITRGGEAMARARLFERWEIGGGYTFTQAFLRDNPSSQLPHQPLHRAHLTSSVELADQIPLKGLKALQIMSTLHYRSAVNLDNFENLQNRPALRLDAGLSADFRHGLGGAVHLQNIFNDRQIQDSLQRPLPGRSIFFSLNGSFRREE